MTTRVQAGARAPERLQITITNQDLASEPLDLSTVTSADLLVRSPYDQAPVPWAATIVVQVTGVLVLEHVFDLNDVYQPGIYAVNVTLNVPGGVRRVGASVLVVT